MIDAAPFVPGQDGPVRKLAYLWRTRDIQLVELFFSVLALPLWSSWLLIPWPRLFGAKESFSNPSFKVLKAIASQGVWGCVGLVVALVWAYGILESCRNCRQAGSFCTALIYLFVTYSLAIVAISSPGVAIYGSAAFMCGFLFVRQRWGIGAGEP